MQVTASLLGHMPIAALERLGQQLDSCAFVNGAYCALYDIPCSLRVIDAPYNPATCQAMFESALDMAEQRQGGDSALRDSLNLYVVARACMERDATDTSSFVRIRRIVERVPQQGGTATALLDVLAT